MFRLTAKLTLFPVIDRVYLSARQLIEEGNLIRCTGGGEYLVGAERDCQGKRMNSCLRNGKGEEHTSELVSSHSYAGCSLQTRRDSISLQFHFS
jgi:hypothetical protein